MLPDEATSRCRSCQAPLVTTFADLGLSPISNAFPVVGTLQVAEQILPLKAMVCDRCLLVQIEDVADRAAHFNDDYAYFSSVSTSWLDHARSYAEMAVARFALTPGSRVVEIASNDGYLLRHLVERGIPCLGVDPAGNCAAAARRYGIDTEIGFFGYDMAVALAAAPGGRADLIIANNVLAHVPDLDDFVAGFSALLKPEGTITFEFPHLLTLVAGGQFDTIYHEHYSYLSLLALKPLFRRHRLAVFDVDRLATHGGSLRLYVAHDAAGRRESESVHALAGDEQRACLHRIETYRRFDHTVRAAKRALLTCLIGLKENDATICGYGAPAKGTTLLNYCGIGADFLDFTVDRNGEKQGRRIPGTRIAILAPEAIRKRKPDYVLILPWNLKEEIMTDLAYIREWGGKFVLPVPRPEIIV